MEDLPVELLHRIFDNLDAETIFFSLRSVCRLFRSIVQTYNRYHINFQSISKSNFAILLHFIPTQHIQNLTLYNTDCIPNQIPTALSSIRLRQFNCLYSLNLFSIEEVNFNYLLKRLNISSLKSFSLDIQKYDDRRKKTTEHYLSQIVSLPTLRRLNLNLNEARISNIKWPIQCQIETLIIHDNFTYEILCGIFSCSPRLHRLIIKQDLHSLIRNQTLKTSFSQLHSLTIEKLDVTITELQSFLCLTSSLRYLKIFGYGYFDNGKEWEEFIELNLPHLDQLEFFISLSSFDPAKNSNLKEIIDSFRSPFWIECKKWFVAGHSELTNARRKYIYSLPICNPNFQSNLTSTINCSTSPNFIINNHVNELHMSLKHHTTSDDLNEIFIPFPNIAKLKIDFDQKVSKQLSKVFKKHLLISNLVEVKLESFYFNKNNCDLIISIIRWLANAPRLSNLRIHSQYCKYELYPYLNDILSILPHQIKDLQISINKIEQIPMIVERCPNLVVLRLDITRRKICDQVRRWFEQNTKGSVLQKQYQQGCEVIWIGKRIEKEEEEEEINCKRLKLMDNIDES